MLNFLRLILGIFIFFILILLINISFFGGGEQKKISIDYNMNYSLSGSFVNTINDLDNIYTNDKGNFDIKSKGNNFVLNLKSGIFIIEINDISKKYKIIGNGFNLDIKSPGDIYIDTTNKDNIIVSLNSSFNILFLDKNKEIVNSYFMYPHEWIKFNPTFIYKNYDLYRIKTVTKNGYISKRLFSFFKKENNNTLISKKGILLFSNYLKNKKNIFNKNNDFYKQIISLEKVSFPFFEFINKYKYYFVNDIKKIIFLQNNIHNNIYDILRNKQNNNKKYLDIIISDLNTLKNINEQEYINTLKYIRNIYEVYILKNNINDFSIINDILYILENKKNINYKYSFIILKNLYVYGDLNDFGISKSKFNLFLKQYLNTLDDKENINQLESILFYLYDFINTDLFIKSTNDLNLEIDLLAKYIELSKKVYFSNNLKNNSSKIKTIIVKNKSLLINIEKYLRNTYFKTNRNNMNLLELKNNNFNSKIILKLKENIDSIFMLFNSNKIFFKGIDVKEYNNLFKKFDEEFLALQDYEKYNIKYNKNLSDLYNYSGIGAKKDKKYTKSEIMSYLKQFNGLSFNDNYEIISKENYFIIKKILLLGNTYDFYLYPNLGNKVKIYKYVDEKLEKNPFIYDLDSYKNILEEKFKSAKREEKYKYDFKNFFIQKFKKSTNINTNTSIEEICALRNMVPDYTKENECKVKNSDSEAISVFKSNVLIGEEFSIIKDYFNVNYNNLDVVYKNSGYLISLNNIIININIKENNNSKKYKLLFKSDYNIKTHEFYNIKFQMEVDKKYLFDQSFINIRYKKIKITQLKKFLEDYLKKINNIRNIYSTLRGNMILNNLVIDDIYGKKLLKFNVKNKKIVIKVEKDNIFSIIINDINILDKNININSLKNYIDKLN